MMKRSMRKPIRTAIVSLLSAAAMLISLAANCMAAETFTANNKATATVSNTKTTSLAPNTEQYLFTVNKDANISAITVKTNGETISPASTVANTSNYWINKGETATIEAVCADGYEIGAGGGDYDINELTQTTDVLAKPQGSYLIRWKRPLSSHIPQNDPGTVDYLGTGSYTVGDLTTTGETLTGKEGWKRIAYTKPDGSTAYANPFEPGCIYIKKGTYIEFQMVAGTYGGSLGRFFDELESNERPKNGADSMTLGHPSTLTKVYWLPKSDFTSDFRLFDTYKLVSGKSHYTWTGYRNTSVLSLSGDTDSITKVKCCYNRTGSGYESFTSYANMPVYPGMKVILYHSDSLNWIYRDFDGNEHDLGENTACQFTVPSSASGKANLVIDNGVLRFENNRTGGWIADSACFPVLGE